MNIEELAFKNIEELEQEDELILYDIIDFLQKDRKQWINQYTRAHNDYVNLQQQNQKYKEAIDKAKNNSQYWIDYYTKLNSDERIALRLQENIDILKEVE